MEIARAAAGLFVRHGLRATRAEDIAQTAGIAPRTFYRYFATKEEAVAPLYAAGSRRWVEAVRAVPADVGLLRALEVGARHTLTPGAGVSAASWEWVRTLLRLADANPSLRRVWAEVCQASERLLAEALAERLTRVAGSGGSGGSCGSGAASGESGDGSGDPERGEARPGGLASLPGEASSGSSAPMPGEASSGGLAPLPGEARSVAPLPGEGRPGRPVRLPGEASPDNVAPAPDLRFAAAVASAAVRTAMEAWAEGEGPVEGPGGPADLALRNLAALRDFPWAG